MSSKAMWTRIGGYPEWFVNFHMDSLLNAKFGSVFGGVLETTLEGGVFHQWHPKSSKASWPEPMDWPVPMCDMICCEGSSSSGGGGSSSSSSSSVGDVSGSCQDAWSSAAHTHNDGDDVTTGCSDGALTSDVWGLENMLLPECESKRGGSGWVCHGQ